MQVVDNAVLERFALAQQAQRARVLAARLVAGVLVVGDGIEARLQMALVCLAIASACDEDRERRRDC